MGLRPFFVWSHLARSLQLDLKHCPESTAAAALNGRAINSAAFAEDQATIGEGNRNWRRPGQL